MPRVLTKQRIWLTTLTIFLIGNAISLLSWPIGLTSGRLFGFGRPIAFYQGLDTVGNGEFFPTPLALNGFMFVFSCIAWEGYERMQHG